MSFFYYLEPFEATFDLKQCDQQTETDPCIELRCAQLININ